jgi:preprotein translocase subunit SecG
MTIFLTVLHVMVCMVLVVVVLLQHGKGADIGAVFGGGASTTVFGSRGAGNFLTRLTTGAALLFMVTSLSLSYLANRQRSIFEEEAPPTAGAPAPAPEDRAPTPEGTPAAPPAPAGEAAPAGGGFEEVEPGAPAAKAPEAVPPAPAKPATPAAP